MDKRNSTSIILPILLLIAAAIGWYFIVRIPQETIKPLNVATTDIQIPCVGDNNTQATEKTDNTQPSITATPPCGTFSQQNGTSGTTIAVRGIGFLPNTETELLWIDDAGNEFRHRQNGEYVKVTTNQNGEFQVDLTMPYNILPASLTKDMAVWTLKAQQIKVEEEITTIEIEPIANHALISVLGWVLGSAIGLGIGFVVFRGLKSIIIAKPKTYEFIILFPWRTIMMSLLLLTLYPLTFHLPSFIIFGVGKWMGTMSVGTAITILSVAFAVSMLLENWHPTQFIPRLIAISRTLATLSAVLTYIVGVFGGGGMSHTIIWYSRLFEFEFVYRYYGSIVILMLIPDTVLGILQHHFTKRSLTEREQR